MSNRFPVLLALVLLATGPISAQVFAQVSGPPRGGSNQLLGAPTGTSQDFIGTWALSWDGPVNSGCPCHGKLTVKFDESGKGLDGLWEMKGSDAVMSGPVSFDQNVWAGRFTQAEDEAGSGMKGYFRMEVRDRASLTGSYQPLGTAIPFHWSATRL